MTAVTNESVRPATGSAPVRRAARKAPTWWQAFGGLLALMLGAAGVQTLVQTGPSLAAGALVALGVSVIGWIALSTSWRGVWRYLTSSHAAVVELTLVMACTVLGTLILQRLPDHVFAQRYGDLAPILADLHFDDIFHSYPFVLVLFFIALSSGAVVVLRWRAFRKWYHLGRLVAHVSVVLLLLGGFISMLTAQKGMLHLEVGQEASSFFVEPNRHNPMGERVDLGFSVRLDRFELDQYEPDYRFYTFQPTREGGYQVVASDRATEGARVGAPAPGHAIEVKVERVFERFALAWDWVADPDGRPGLEARPAARMTVELPGASPTQVWLAAPQQGAPVWREPAGRFEVRLFWDKPAPEVIATFGQARQPDAHYLTLPDGRDILVEPGRTYPLDPRGNSLRVDAYLPDFTYDIQSKRASSKSDQPNNPTLVVTLLPADGAAGTSSYLFGKQELKEGARPGHQAAPLTYTFVPGRDGAARSILLIGASGERLDVVAGEVVGAAPVQWGSPITIAAGDQTSRVTVAAPLRRAAMVPRYLDDPDSERRIAAEITITRPGEAPQRTVVLAEASQPIPMGDGRLMVFREKSESVRAFISNVTVLEGGVPVTTAELRVNEPLVYGGFYLYQANYNPDNPNYSGIQAVYDAGLPLVNVAFWLLMLAVVQVVALRYWTPWWAGRATGPPRRRPRR